MIVLPSPVMGVYQSSKEFRLIRNIRARINAMDTQLSINRHCYSDDRGAEIWKMQRRNLARLDSNPLIGETLLNPKSYRQIFRKMEKFSTLEKHATSVFGTYNKLNSNNADWLQKIILRSLHRHTQAGRKKELITRCTYAITEASSQNQYVIFNTLTADNESYKNGVFNNNDAFNKYIKKIKYDIPGAQHFAVTEQGGKTGRLHIHVLHFLPSLPIHSQDPNTGLLQPIRRELVSMKKYWTYGYSSPIMVRFNPGDAFGQLNCAGQLKKRMVTSARCHHPRRGLWGCI